MAKLVASGAQMTCSMGTSPAALTVLPTNQVTGADAALATVDDFQPMVNIPTFGMCQTPSNPQVAAATAAALGVLQPQPCIPVTTAPWTPGSTIATVGGRPALTKDCSCMCMWGGAIQVSDPGQTLVDVDG
jgi:hypothetical protein